MVNPLNGILYRHCEEEDNSIWSNMGLSPRQIEGKKPRCRRVSVVWSQLGCGVYIHVAHISFMFTQIHVFFACL